MSAAKRRRKAAQTEIEFSRPRTWGGARDHAGRKKTKMSRVPRRTRADFKKGEPVHVTLRVLGSVAGLRRKTIYREIRAVLRHSGHREEFRICHYSVQGNHLHLVCEAADKVALARGIQRFASMVGRRINRCRATRGTVFADRYHSRALTTPTEVRNALRYVLNNWRHHRSDQAWPTDPFSSGSLFDGWSDAEVEARPAWLDPDEPVPVAPARSWLLTTGWRRRGLISTREVPS